LPNRPRAGLIAQQTPPVIFDLISLAIRRASG
jgi:hypothetical protein